jgi:hypothetical protein
MNVAAWWSSLPLLSDPSQPARLTTKSLPGNSEQPLNPAFPYIACTNSE